MNYPGIFFLMALENIFPPIPSELIMPVAGFKAGSGELNLWGAILAGSLGSLLGQTVLYYLGRKIGADRLKEWTEKHGEWVGLAPEDIDNGEKWFEKHGNKAAFFGRLVPGLRSLVSIPAGLHEMPRTKFLLYSGAGTLIWTAALAFLGQILGRNFEAIGQYIGIISKVVLGGLLAYFLFRIAKRKWEKRTADA
ncbi:MAG: DedA family protein [Capsulimonadales bacterium]|nr:DedA family protein [Capsulimonadales bacterium]